VAVRVQDPYQCVAATVADNLVYREEEREMIPLCRYLGVGVIPWSPLARGLLTGSRRRDQPPATVRAATDQYAHELYSAADFDTVDALLTVATARGIPPAQVALAWLLARPGITAPIAPPDRNTSTMPSRPYRPFSTSKRSRA